MPWPPSLLAKSPRQVWMAAAGAAAAVLLIALLIARPVLTFALEGRRALAGAEWLPRAQQAQIN